MGITIKGMLTRVTTAKNGIEPQMPKIIESIKEKILDLNRGQLASNKNTFDKNIGFYSPGTERILLAQKLLGYNVRLKKAGDPFDFQQTGGFFKEFDLYYEQGQLELFSNDYKDQLLLAKYDFIYGLTNKNMRHYNYVLVKPLLLTYIRSVLYE
jgi:hypothetical protein